VPTTKESVMNKQRRKRITALHDELTAIRDHLVECCGDEQDTIDNLPDSLQGSARGQEMSDAVDNLDNAINALEEAIVALESIN
jgi:hypothetical protein